MHPANKFCTKCGTPVSVVPTTTQEAGNTPQVTFLEISRFQEFCMLGTALVLTILYYMIFGVPLAIGWLIGKAGRGTR